MQTRLFKQDQEPMLKQEFNFDDMAMYLLEDEDHGACIEDEDYGAFIKVENEEAIKRMIVAENRPQTPPRPPTQKRWRNNASVIIERQPVFDRILSQAKHTREATSPPPPLSSSRSSRSRKRADTIIDPYNPKNHCAKCNKTYLHHSSLRRHIKVAHHSHIKYLKRPHAKIDPYHPQHYCAKCDRNYPGSYFYRHVRVTHGLQLETPKPSRAIGKPNTLQKRLEQPQQLSCAKCNRTYSTESKLRWHSKREHGDKVPCKYPNAEIDVFHLKHYCAKCDKTYINTSRFLAHLQDQHKPTLYNTRDAAKISNKRNPTYYCPKCDRYYNEKIFKQHFKNHRVSRPVIVNPDAEIDMNSPDFYCSKCEHCSSGLNSFRSHVISVHGLSFEFARAMRQKRAIYPDAEIDFYGTVGYCAKCDKSLSSRRALIGHAAAVHDVHPPPPPSREPVEHGAYSLRNGKKLTPLFR